MWWQQAFPTPYLHTSANHSGCYHISTHRRLIALLLGITFSLCSLDVLAASDNTSSGQPTHITPGVIRAITVPVIAVPADSATVNLPVQIKFDLPMAKAATNYALEIAYWHPKRSTWQYVGLLGAPFTGQSLTLTGEQLSTYSKEATLWQIRVRMNEPPGPWSAWRSFRLTSAPITSQSALSTAKHMDSQAAGSADVFTAKLGVAVGLAGGTKKWDVGASETHVYQATPKLHLAWESKFQNTYQWQWQLSTHPFPKDLSNPGNLIDAQSAATGNFYIDLGKYQQSQRVAQSRQRSSTLNMNKQISNGLTPPTDVYVRLVPLTAGKIAAPASNSVTVHFNPGSNPAFAEVGKVIAKDQETKAEAKAWEEANRIYSLSIKSWEPVVFDDPNRWGCVIVVKNPYVGDPFHPLARYKPGKEYCPPVDPSTQQKSWDQWVVVALESYLIAYDGLTKFYNGIKHKIAKAFKDLVPCEYLGKDLEQSCDDAFEYAANAALSAAMAYAGVPPEFPTLDTIKAAGKGEIVDAAVAASCEVIKANNGECTPAIQEGLKKAFEAGLNKLEHELVHQDSEPNCGDEQTAKYHGLLPLPCFTNYPGTEVHPGKGAVYEPAVVVVDVKKVKAGPFDNGGRASKAHPYISCKLTAGLILDNEINDKTISGHYYKHADLHGRPFDFSSAQIPRLKVGESVNVSLVFTKMLPLEFPGNVHITSMSGWVFLYLGGKGPLSATSNCAVNEAKMQVSIPKP